MPHVGPLLEGRAFFCPHCGGSQMDAAINDSLLIFGALAILLAPLTLVIDQTGHGGTAWKLLSFFAVSLLHGSCFSAQVCSSRLWRGF